MAWPRLMLKRKTRTTLIAVIANGPIDAATESIEWIINELANFYNKIEEGETVIHGRPVSPPDYVELHVYLDRRAMISSLAEEMLELGMNLAPAYTVMHDAWKGYPRIHVNLEEVDRLPRTIMRSLVLHEAAHSVLHGSLEYYVVGLPGTSSDELLVYSLLSAGYKDLEVAELLRALGLEDELKRYAEWILEFLEPSCDSLLELARLFKETAIPFSINMEIMVEQDCRSKLERLYNTARRLLELDKTPSLKYQLLYRALLDAVGETVGVQASKTSFWPNI
ncbi:MAG: hypothetical protein ABWW69_03110 [Pyrodictiaceae archaeon]